MRNFVLMAAVVLSLGACATSASQDASTPENYTSTRLDETHWRVEFVGDAERSQDEVEARLLQRAAELTISSGYDWFVPSDQSVDTESEVIVEGQRQRVESPVWRPMWRHQGRFFWSDWMVRGAAAPEGPTTPPTVRTTDRLAAREDILMGRGAAPQGAFNARDVLASVGRQAEP